MSARPFGEIAASLLPPQGRKERGSETRPTDSVHRRSFHEDTRPAKPWIVHGGGNRPRWKKVRAAALASFDRQRRKDQTRLKKARRCVRTTGSGEVVSVNKRLHEGDREVFVYLLDRYNHTNGELYPTQETIAEKTGRSESFVEKSLLRLKLRGFLDWTRRTKTKPGAAGQRGPQIEQTSNAYFFPWFENLTGAAREPSSSSWHRG